MKTVLVALASGVVLAASAMAQSGMPGEAMADPGVDAEGYPILPDMRAVLRQGSSAAALASAIAMVDDCAAPLVFDEAWQGDVYLITVHCSDHRGEAAATVEFRVSPRSGDFAYLEPLAIRTDPESRH
ncbi:MAG: hypothetical protein ACJAU5_000398 [Maricaulis maris]|mgnify:CR=1 FL=1|jgi:hypothetical protein|uniref:Lipoprotein n=1 Tax=Maricaulis maris (strain MCS10) TaxID=394221 RepID=Q0AQZ8_MARMM|nr:MULTISPECIES: hypothetical protein [Maricaulis]ABI65289.1 hypothetical protein Mmar10_0996 [Maricaulis maris MCS10]MAC88342.1 hypothetical protein [Maricaulis sp.]